MRLNGSPLPATLANWKIMARSWRTTLAPILINRVCRLISDQLAVPFNAHPGDLLPLNVQSDKRNGILHVPMDGRPHICPCALGPCSLGRYLASASPQHEIGLGSRVLLVIPKVRDDLHAVALERIWPMALLADLIGGAQPR